VSNLLDFIKSLLAIRLYFILRYGSWNFYCYLDPIMLVSSPRLWFSTLKRYELSNEAKRCPKELFVLMWLEVLGAWYLEDQVTTL